MSAQRPGTGRSSLIVTALLLSTAIAAPALAQVEQVVVTAQRKSENVQNVPIAVTAFTAEDMKAHQITMAKDLEFATPNVTYSKTNFSGDDFTIRGIGNDVITGGGESGVMVSFDNIYIAGASLALGAFYDIDQVSVLEGPQSSLYGRGATAGAVNIVPKKPDLEQASVEASFSYGNYNANQDIVTVNLPIVTDELALRVSADREYHDGYVTNDFYNNHIDSNDTYSFRGTLRWQPTDGTTIDIMAQTFSKDDSNMRSERQQCLWDPSGTLGCLPSGLSNDSINENAFFSADLASNQAMQNTFGAFVPDAQALGIANLQVQAPHLTNPGNSWTVNTDFNPTWKVSDTFFAVNAKQKVNSWLDFEANFGYDHSSSISQESYNNGAAEALPANLGTYGPAVYGSTVLGTLWDVLDGFGGAGYAANFNQYFDHTYSCNNPVPGSTCTLLPVSGFQNLGLSTNNVKYYTNTFSTFDQSNAEQEQYSLDIRFSTHLNGPINGMLGAFFLRQEGWGDYYVSSGAQGYGSAALGSILGLVLDPGQCFAQGCTETTAYYDNSSPAPGGVTLKSQSVYGEVYYDIVPDLLKLTAGMRWTDDYKSQLDRITLFNTLEPIGTKAYPDVGTSCVPKPTPVSAYDDCSGTYNKVTGRAVLNYTPKLDFTDQTLIYFSYGRGYKAGGFNPGLSTFAVNSGVPATYQPEGIDAFELGTKNNLLNDTLQANLDVWYYNYEGLQISQILDNDSINFNVNSRMYGSEGQLVYAPDEHWAFNFSVGYVHSALGNQGLVDPRNPTNGQPGAVLIKDATLSSTAAQNCAVYLNGATVAPGDNAALALAFAAAGLADPYFDPPGGSAQLAPNGIPLTNYGDCNPADIGTQLHPGPIGAILLANGYSLNDPNGNGNQNGVLVNIHGNQNPNTPPWTLSLGAQYTWNVGNDYTLVPRVDVHYQTDMWGRVFEDPADKIQGFFTANAQMQLNAPDDAWFVQGFIKNVFNKVYVTGEYLTSSSSGLYTNEFLGDPRTYGVRVGVKF